MEEMKKGYPKIARGLSFGIFKGVKGKFGALRLNPNFPTKAQLMSGYEGCVFLESSPAKGPNQYDWENSKVSVKLSKSDMSKMAMFLQSPDRQHYFCKKDDNGNNTFQIYHDTTKRSGASGIENKTITFTKNPDKHSVMVSIVHRINRNSEQKEVRILIPIAPDEGWYMYQLLMRASYKIIGW